MNAGKRLKYVGNNLKAVREELGLSVRRVARMLGVTRALVHHYETEGVCEPLWARLANMYVNHPDLKYATTPYIEFLKEGLVRESPLFLSLMGVYGRERMRLRLMGMTNEEVLEDLREKAKDFRWSAKDINCMRRRVDAPEPEEEDDDQVRD